VGTRPLFNAGKGKPPAVWFSCLETFGAVAFGKAAFATGAFGAKPF
jgi:hypothetical protein